MHSYRVTMGLVLAFAATGCFSTAKPNRILGPPDLDTMDRSHAIAVNSALFAACRLGPSGTVHCWYQSPITEHRVPRKLPVPEPATSLVSTSFGFCAVTTMHRVFCWQDLDVSHVTEWEQLRGSLSVVDIAPEMCGLFPNGVMRCWEHISSFKNPAPLVLSGVTWGSGDFPARPCYLNTDGRVFCWTLIRALSADVFGLPKKEPMVVYRGLPFFLDIPERAVGLAPGNYTCANTESGMVFCWKQAGFDNPQPVSGSPPIRKISGGGGMGCGVDEAGKVWCWATSRRPALAEYVSPNTAVHIPLDGHVKEVAANGHFACALLVGGSTRCWGECRNISPIADTNAPESEPVLCPQYVVPP